MKEFDAITTNHPSHPALARITAGQRQQRIQLYALGLWFMGGILDVIYSTTFFGPGWLRELMNPAGLVFMGSLVLAYRWLLIDSMERRRSYSFSDHLLNVAFSAGYLYQTRDHGERVSAMAAYIALCASCAMASFVGGYLAIGAFIKFKVTSS
ncbi:hypothetical protein SAMN05216570_3387 [Dyella sp. OK004]|uniref:hypothetical protein n=1 Tax=Dyella sp. OK004 TaxID=1855292 RepID=UPI0008F0E734|nr:hypothetical protein [Dyella sp. OK004]SFS16808.1 hypothetical protein SAMN05216570_3387 [Dyella sp. OK004]